MVSPNGEDAVIESIKCCFICGGSEFNNHTSDYQACTKCGHEILTTTQNQGFIINDNLSEKEVHQITGLDRFKARMLAFFDRGLERNQLFDIGSASGKFMLHNAHRYKYATGLEITPECLSFSRQVLQLNVIEDIKNIPTEISTATAWHSLEHIPEQHLLALLDGLSKRMISGGRVIISVPNSGSWQYRFFGKAYAYYDVPNHLHQFTPDSLERLMQRFDFIHVATVNSWAYNTFGYTQSLLNILTNTHNYLYYRLKRRSQKPFIALDIINGILLVICVPFGWLLGLADAVKLEKQGVITACFERKNY
jgi:Methyltransferase domain